MGGGTKSAWVALLLACASAGACSGGNGGGAPDGGAEGGDALPPPPVDAGGDVDADASDASDGGPALLTGSLTFGNDSPDCVVRQSTGKLVVLGLNTNGPGASTDTFADVVSFRLAANGAADPAWNPIVTHIGRMGEITGCAAQPDDKIVFAALAQLEDATYVDVVARLTANGALDTTFGSGRGWVTYAFGYGAFGLVVQPDGKLVTATSHVGGTGFDGVQLLRFDTDGTLDATFGTSGVATRTVSNQLAIGVAIQSSGSLLTLSGTMNGPQQSFSVTRFTTAGAVDTTFAGGAGFLTQSVTSGTMYPRAFGVDGTDRIVVLAGQGGANSAFFRFGSDGALDTTFGSSGSATSTGGDFGLAVASDGTFATIQQAATTTNVARYVADGSVDTTFGASGLAATSLNGNAYALLPLPSGGFVVAGTKPGSSTTPSSIDLASVTAAGAIDATFGTAGTTTVGGGPARDWLTGVVVRPDGRIVGAGHTPENGQTDFLAQWQASGALDSTFGTQGILTNAGFTLGRLALATSGKLVGINVGHFQVGQYTADGAHDATFGTNGLANASFGASVTAQAWSLALDGSDRPILGGGADADLALARLTTSGVLDTTFGTAGLVRTTIPNYSYPQAQAIAVRGDGKIAVAAATGTALLALRYDATGALDTTFAGTGYQPFDFGGQEPTVYALLPESDGSEVIVGVIANNTPATALGTLFLLRFTDAGALDTTFGSGGEVTEPLTVPESFGDLVSAVLDASGRIVVSTRANDTASGGARSDMLFLRYTSAGALDTTFGSGGRLLVTLSAGSDAPLATALQPDGVVAVGGRTWSPTGGADMALLRLP